MKYIAVFKSLTYAQRIQNKFKADKMPLIIKTPKSLAGGCSYSLEFSDELLSDIIKYTNSNNRGFVGIYKISSNLSNFQRNDFEKMNV